MRKHIERAVLRSRGGIMEILIHWAYKNLLGNQLTSIKANAMV